MQVINYIVYDCLYSYLVTSGNLIYRRKKLLYKADVAILF
jgi:hypothetical protein